jgi:hypothetical protein
VLTQITDLMAEIRFLVYLCQNCYCIMLSQDLQR